MFDSLTARSPPSTSVCGKRSGDSGVDLSLSHASLLIEGIRAEADARALAGRLPVTPVENPNMRPIRRSPTHALFECGLPDLDYQPRIVYSTAIWVAMAAVFRTRGP